MDIAVFMVKWYNHGDTSVNRNIIFLANDSDHLGRLSKDAYSPANGRGCIAWFAILIHPAYNPKIDEG